MYEKSIYAMGEKQWIDRLLREDPFATLISTTVDGPFVSHLPLLWRPDLGAKGQLLGHLARGNPHCRIWEKDPSVYAIFHGPHEYITSSWYGENDVPTWNYATVHIRGRLRLYTEYSQLEELLRESVHTFEQGNPTPWRFELPEDLADPEQVMRFIAGFAIDVEEVQAKFKLSQNRSAADQRAVIAGLEARGNFSSARLASWMRGVLGVTKL